MTENHCAVMAPHPTPPQHHHHSQVKRIKDLLEKYYKPGAGGGGKAAAATSKKHMDQIQQEMMVIFDKLETLDETALPTLEGIENASESSLSPGGGEDRGAKTLGANPKQPLREDIDRISDRVTPVGGAPMTEREAVILECTEYSIQSLEETDAVSRVAQLEMQALDSKVSYCPPSPPLVAIIPPHFSHHSLAHHHHYWALC